jgi:prophage tail gpP-like protein
MTMNKNEVFILTSKRSVTNLNSGGTSKSSRITGWESFRLTRSIERCPSDVEMTMTERRKGEFKDAALFPGQPVEVWIGQDRILTGYIDQYLASVDPYHHRIRVTARGKCQDLVDCAPEWPSGQISNSNALQIAEKLAAPYGIKVRLNNGRFRQSSPIPNAAKTGDTGYVYEEAPPLVIIPQSNLILTSTPFAEIEERCRWARLIPFEDVDGNLVLSWVGGNLQMTPLVMGVNIERLNMAFSAHDKFSEYHVVRLSIDLFSDIGAGENTTAVFADTTVNRHRIKRFMADGVYQQDFVGAEARCVWERNRHFGRSMQLTVTTDSWRDASGNLWEINELVRVSAPDASLSEFVPEDRRWLITAVTFRLDESGTHADLVLMPPEGFEPYLAALPGLADMPDGRTLNQQTK